ncbi:right-handed parallel beta-helix repeat-containing protein [Planctomycetota bacterium]
MVDLVEPNTIDARNRLESYIGKFIYGEERPSQWHAEEDLWVHGYWFHDWADGYHKVASLDTSQQSVTVALPYHVYGYRTGQWFYWFNILTELDMPGEWYLDREQGALYFWPPETIRPGHVQVSISEGLLNLNGVSYVRFQGIIFEASRGTAIYMKDCRYTSIMGCDIRNLGRNAVKIKEGVCNSVLSCNIYGTAAGGIELKGGDRASLEAGGHVIDNNHIHHYARWYRTYTPAISISGVGNRVSHNKIHDAPHMAVQFRGNDHRIQYNEISDVCLETNDAGAIYAGRDWTMRGTLIQHNYLHDITGYRDQGCVGLYLDDMFCGTHVEGNIFSRVTRAIFIGGGRDCRVKNNLFINCDPSLRIDARAMGWAKAAAETIMMERLTAMPYRLPPWSERYPELVTILEDDPVVPKGNVITRNISCGGEWEDITQAARPYIHLADNWVNTEGLIEGTLSEIHAWQQSTSVLARGFIPIDLGRIGLYLDVHRKELPSHD